MNETISVDITPNSTFYFKSVTCTDGYSLVNTLTTGESANKKQTIEIKNNNKKGNGTSGNPWILSDSY